jgi:hypothetical protein
MSRPAPLAQQDDTGVKLAHWCDSRRPARTWVTPSAIGVSLEARLANYEYNGYEKGNRRVSLLETCVITSRQNKI